MKRYAWILLVVLGLGLQGCSVSVKANIISFDPSECREDYRWVDGKGFYHTVACVHIEPVPEGTLPL